MNERACMSRFANDMFEKYTDERGSKSGLPYQNRAGWFWQIGILLLIGRARQRPVPSAEFEQEWTARQTGM